MTKFVDANRREWNLSCTLHTVAQLKQTGIDLIDTFYNPGRVYEFIHDPIKLAKVGWEMVAKQTGVTPHESEFIAGIGAEQLESLAEAIIQEATAIAYFGKGRLESGREALKKDLETINLAFAEGVKNG